MGLTFKLTKKDSADIAFAETCLMSGAVNQEEFRQWLYYLIENVDDVPTYIFDLLDVEDLRDMFKGPGGPIGFFTSSDLSDAESDAVTGIAFKRGHYNQPLDYDVDIDRDVALLTLEQNRHIEDRFKEFFPFIKI